MQALKQKNRPEKKPPIPNKKKKRPINGTGNLSVRKKTIAAVIVSAKYLTLSFFHSFRDFIINLES